jgi:hypothetical protein
MFKKNAVLVRACPVVFFYMDRYNRGYKEICY